MIIIHIRLSGFKELFLFVNDHLSASHYTVWFGLALWHINRCRLFNAKSILYILTVLFQTIWFSISTQFTSILPIDRTLSDLPLRVRVDLRAKAIKGYSTFPKAPAFWNLTIRSFNVISGIYPTLFWNHKSKITHSRL